MVPAECRVLLPCCPLQDFSCGPHFGSYMYLQVGQRSAVGMQTQNISNRVRPLQALRLLQLRVPTHGTAPACEIVQTWCCG